MGQQQSITYVMLTSERRLQLLEEIQTRHAAWIAVNLPPDSLEHEEEEQQASEAHMEGEEEVGADPTPPATRFGIGDAQAEYGVTQADRRRRSSKPSSIPSSRNRR